MFENRLRPVVAGTHGAVASAHPLASQAGLDTLRNGGNAVDAVVSMAATLNVVEPYMSGVGGVGFLLLHLTDGPTRVLNFSGNTPAAATPDQFTPELQDVGPKACLIPGNVAGWFEALDSHGTQSATDVMSAAICLAEQGFPLHPLNAQIIEKTLPRLNPAGRAIYGKQPPRVGAVLRQPELAGTLRAIAQHGPDYFYRGPLAHRIADHIQAEGGLLSREDLAGYAPEWQEPISVTYRGFEVMTCPPNCEGFQMLQTLQLLEATDLRSLGHNSAEYIHLLSEAMKLATADRIHWCGDPKFHDIPLERLLSEDYAAARRQWMNPAVASKSEGERWSGSPTSDVVSPGKIDGLTTHLTAVDAVGNVASITQSLGNAFGCGVVVPGTGVAMNNFVFWTEIDPACPTPNLIQPGKRWSCCMSPLQVFRTPADGAVGRDFWFSIATPGSYGILQTTVQMLLNAVEFGADVQQAIEAPRFRLYEGTRMQIEDRVTEAARGELTARGHAVEPIGDYSMLVGGGQSVMIDPESGARLAGADPRRDGYALAY
ncbi:MAG: gamma-glutamyltransferase [Planctomycetota bacterium]|nr:gamma-glutamyltransferase [Planctomycetota bacterium]